MKKRVFCTVLVAFLAFVSFISTTAAWMIMSVREFHLQIDGSYTSVYFDELSGDGSSPTFTGEIAQDGRKIGPYVITRPSHLYNLAKLQELDDDNVILNSNSYHFQVGLPLTSTGVVCIDANGNPEYTPDSANVAAYRVYTNNTSSVFTNILNMLNYSGASSLVPIGTATQKFHSSFYGNNVTIANVNVTATGGQHAGLFGYVESQIVQVDGVDTYATTIKDFILDTPYVVSTESETVTESYAGYVIGYLYGGNVTNIGVYNGKMRLNMQSNRQSPYKSNYGYIGYSKDAVNEGAGGTAPGGTLDANLDFSQIANALVSEINPARPWFIRRDGNNNVTSVLLSAFAAAQGTTHLNALVPNAFGSNVFDIEGNATYYTTYSDEYVQNASGYGYNFSGSKPFLDVSLNKVPLPGAAASTVDVNDPSTYFSLTHDMTTGVWGVSGDSISIEFTTTGAGTFYFAYGLTGAYEVFTIDIYDTTITDGDPVASYARNTTTEPGIMYDVFARALSIPYASTFRVEFSGSYFLYMRFYMSHQLGNLGEQGEVGDIDFIYKTNNVLVPITDDGYVPSGVVLTFNLASASGAQFVFNTYRPTSVANVSYYSNIPTAVVAQAGSTTALTSEP